ncbi:MAG: type II toxin-antitoxin system VapC family toxin [Chloroflexota bacterium]
MSLVIDANIIAALVLPLPYSDQATHSVATWKKAGAILYAPLLLEYEVSTILRKAITYGWLTTEAAAEAMGTVSTLNIQCQLPSPDLHAQALRWAERLGHSKTYDAHYLALAEQLRAELWTADRRLANGAKQAGAAWVHWIGEMDLT